MEAFELVGDGPVYTGAVSTSLQVRGGTGRWHLILRPEAPLDSRGYDRLHFAFQRGTAHGPSTSSFAVAAAPGTRVSLVGPERANFELENWQIVDVPMEQFGLGDRPVEAIDFSGDFGATFFIDDLRFVAAASTDPPVTAVGGDQVRAAPERFALEQNAPNPFNAETVFRFLLPAPRDIELAVFDISGRKLITLARGPHKTGAYTVHWDGRDARGSELASGIYLFQLRDGLRGQTRKAVLLR